MVKSAYGIVAYISKPSTTLLPHMLKSEKEAKLINYDTNYRAKWRFHK